MTIRGNHLQCDMRGMCISCSIYTWPPKMKSPKQFYHCEHCQLDILCDRGLSISYDYFDDGYVEKKVKCIKCERIVLKKSWPAIPKRLAQELLKVK